MKTIDINCKHHCLIRKNFVEFLLFEILPPIDLQVVKHLFQIPFCILADHKTKSIVVSIRGSWSIADVFTDLAAYPEEFSAPGFPDNTFAHYGVTKSCNQIIKNLMDNNLLDSILEKFPGYDLVFTGHSLGAALAILVGAKLRSKYRNLMVYGFGTPSGMLTREAARYTEQFAFTVVIGDDCFARVSVEAVENLKIGILETLQSCRLSKVNLFYFLLISKQCSLFDYSF